MNSFQRFKRRKAFAYAGLFMLGLAVVYWVISEGSEKEEAAPPPSEIAEKTAQAPATAAAETIPVRPSFDVVRISRGGTGVIAGRARPGAVVEVYSNETLVGTATADAAGEWVMILEDPLKSGAAELSLVAREAGEKPRQSKNVVVISVPERKEEEKPLEGVVAVLTPRDGIGPSRVLQKPGATPVAEIGDSLTVDTLDYGDEGEIIMSGRAVPRAQVAIYLDNDFLGATKATDDGFWLLEPGLAMPSGSHILRVDQVLAEGDVQLRIAQPFEAGLPIDPELRKGKVIVQPGNSLWHIARRIYGSGFRYTLIFQENSERIRDPDLIYPGQQFDLPKAHENPAKTG
ncbi:MAG: Ig-like domain-containing protein [Sphingomonadales bacterium]